MSILHLLALAALTAMFLLSRYAENRNKDRISESRKSMIAAMERTISAHEKTIAIQRDTIDMLKKHIGIED